MTRATSTLETPPDQRRPMSRARLAVFRALPTLITVAVCAGVLLWWAPGRGLRLNKAAWKASYFERNLAVPKGGPREGYWGARVGPKISHPQLGWHEAEVEIPGFVNIDESGWQYYRCDAPAKKHRLMIIGGSVAFGAYASSLERTYFHVLGADLERRSLPSEITVVAAGAWKSSQDLQALLLHGEELKPDVVIFLNGLNDLTNGGTATALYGEPVATKDGSKWRTLYHAHDYEQRMETYLENMRRAAEWTAGAKCQMLVALQPSLFERENLTRIERKLLESSLAEHASRESLIDSYQAIRTGLRNLAEFPHVDFLDASRVFDSESETTFADCWHFADSGHAILGAALADKVSEMLTSSPGNAPDTGI
jgi:lysophospholipase L1-like esterase